MNDDKKRPTPLIKWDPKSKSFTRELLLESKHPGDFIIKLLTTIAKYVRNQENKHDPDDIVYNNQYHECHMCGKCCDATMSGFGVMLFPTDLLNYVVSKKGFILVSTTVAGIKQTGLYYVMFDKKRDYVEKMKYHTFLYEDLMVKLNPSLAIVGNDEMDDCVFFDSGSRECTIHDMRPLGCRIYPYALDDANGKLTIKTITDNAPCEKSCFKRGEPEYLKDIKEALYYANCNRLGTDLFYKAKLHSDPRQMLESYSMLVNAFYHAYTSYTKVEMLNGENENVKRDTHSVRETGQGS